MTQRFLDFLSTPLISANESIYGFEPLLLKNKNTYPINESSFTNQRLGKLVEQFVYFQLQQDSKIKLLASNLQIKKKKQTIGELDALLIKEDQPIHLEIIYKFYLYDTLYGYNNPLAYWIGPNRKDTLLYKLDKLKNKQFPLLHNKLTQPHLERNGLKKESITQNIYFKAQLFLPYNSSNSDVKPLNKDCISGFYIPFNKFSIFKNLKFYIPNKIDWLLIPHNNIIWLNYSSARHIIEMQINEKRSPLIWLKFNDIELKKCFITWW